MRRIVAVALAAAAAACSRDTSLPPPPGAGSIQGRVVYAVPGQSSRVAAAGARVTVLGTSIGATAGSDGRFVVANAALSDGELLVQADLDGNGTPDRQTLLSLAALGARPGRDLALGDVVVVENARVRGRVLRADVPGPTGHGGIVVFVPQGPFTTLTGDDGAYLFENLPEGRLSLTFFKDGYDPQGIDGILLGAGQDFAARDVTLARSPPNTGTPAPGAISGQVVLTPAASAEGERVRATQLVPDPSFAASTVPAASGAFRLAGLKPGLYRLEASHPGYVTAVVSNVMVGAGAELQLGVSLSAQGVSADPVNLGTTPTCVAGARCDLPNGCQVGQVNCATGSPVCAPVGSALDGLPCGVNQVCSAGACVSVCVAGASCRPPADPCREGVVSCATGTPACVAGTAPLANGTACGANQVCSAGACTTCFAGLGCTPLNPCDTGLTECGTGTQTCRDTGLAVADGTSCGAGLSCALGACGACQPGKACAPAGFPCHGGTTSCATGREVCVDTGALVADGTSCGANLVCRTGACLACAAGAACSPQNPCHAGSVACGTGLPVCVDQQTNLAAGAGCGADRVCDGAGACLACVQGQACTPTNGCHAGGIQCATGAPVCGDLGVSLANGTSCGPNQVCLSGTCVGCVANADCTPGNPCHYGKTSCLTGAPACGDTGVPLANGASCGTNLVCNAGACGACATGVACGSAVPGAAPAPGVVDPCKVYVTACASGTPACDGTQDQPDGTTCGASLVCRSGACQASPMAIQLAGDLQHALPNQPLPQLLSVTIRNVLTAQGVAGQTVYVTAPAGAQVNRASAVTDPAGVATFALTLGRMVGPQDFVVRHDPSYPTTVAARQLADAPADGTVIPLVNATHVAGTTPVTGPGPAVRLNTPLGIAVASTGDVYFGDQARCQVRKVSPEGVVTVVGGTGSCASGSTGDGGLAVSAGINMPRTLALDEGNRVLYVGERDSHKVRAIDLRTGLISTYAGTGATGTAPYGDGGPATAAQLNWPSAVALGPGPTPALYVVDTMHYLLRRVDPVTGVISTVVKGTYPYCGTRRLELLDFASTGAGTSKGAVAVDARGRVYVAGRLCGTSSAGTIFDGIGRVNDDGSLTLVAGSASGGLGGGPASSAGVGWVSDLAFDSATDGAGAPLQNLYFTDGGLHAVARVDGVTSRVSIVAGIVGAATSTGDFGAGPAATVYQPYGLAFVPGTRDLVLSEALGHVLRLVPGTGRARATDALLASAGGDGQAVYPDQALPAAISVTLTEGAGTPLAGFPVRFALDPTSNGGGWLATSSGTTSAAGVSATTARVGLRLGATRFVAAVDDIHGDPIPGSPITFTATAGPPPAGTVFPVVNDGHVSAGGGAPGALGGPGFGVSIENAYGSVRLPDGSIAFTAGGSGASRVLRLAPDGIVTSLAGGGTGTTDGLPGSSSMLNGALGLALSPGGTTLLVGEAGASRVRALDLATGILTTVAGGTFGCPGTGENGAATAASLCYPGSLAAIGGSLYVGPTANANASTWGDLRRVGIDPANAAEYGQLLPFLYRGASAAGQTTNLATVTSATAPATFWACDGERCSVAADPSGALYVSGAFFGGGFGGGGNVYSNGIARVNPTTGALERIAGRTTATAPSPGLALDRAGFDRSPTIGFDAAGNLWVANRSATAALNLVGWIAPDPVTGHVEATGIFNQVGQTSAPAVPAAGVYLPLGSAYLGTPWSFTFTPDGHVIVPDAGTVLPSDCVKIIW